MNTIILYASHHHGNTKRLVDAIAEQFSVAAADVENQGLPNLSEYDCIGFASGIEFGKFYKSVVNAAKLLMCEGKSVFFLFTCGQVKKTLGKELRALAQERNCRVLGSFGCRGYDTYGPWKLVGGINKSHPNQQDIANAIAFYRSIDSR